MAPSTRSKYPRRTLIAFLCLVLISPLCIPSYTKAAPAQDAYDLSFAWQKQATNLRYIDYEPAYFGIVDDIQGSPFQTQIVNWLIKMKGADIGKTGAIQLLSILLLEDAYQREQDPDRLLKGTQDYAWDILWLAMDGVSSIEKTFAKTLQGMDETHNDLMDQYSLVLETSATGLRFLRLVEAESQNQDLKDAAKDYAELLTQAVAEHEAALTKSLEKQLDAAYDKKLDKMLVKKILGSGEDLFKFVGADLLKDHPAMFVHTLKLFETYSQCGLIVDTITLGGDLLFGTDNIYTRFGELTLLQELSRILRQELRHQLDTVPWTEGILPRDLETYSRLLLDNLALFDLLLRVDARGNYVHEQIVYHDAGLLSLTVETTDFFDKSRALISLYETQGKGVRETAAHLLAMPIGPKEEGIPDGQIQICVNDRPVWQGTVPAPGYAPLTPIANALGYYVQQKSTSDAYIVIADVGQIQIPPLEQMIFVTEDPAILDGDFGSLAVLYLDSGFQIYYPETMEVAFMLPPVLENGELFLSPVDLGKIFRADVMTTDKGLYLETPYYNPYYSPLWPRTEIDWDTWNAIVDELQASEVYNSDDYGDPTTRILKRAGDPGGLLSDVASLTQGRGFARSLTQAERLQGTAQILANRGRAGETIPTSDLLYWARVYFGEDNTEPMAELPETWILPVAQARHEAQVDAHHQVAEDRYTISYQNIAPDGGSNLEIAIMHFEFIDGWRLVLEWVE